MAPLRHRQLIRWLSIVVAVNIVVALVALYAHSGDATGRETRSRVAAGGSSSSTSSTGSTSGGVLAGGHFSKRRGSRTTATGGGPGPSAPAPPGAGRSTGATGASAATPTSGSSTTGTPSTTGTASTTGRPPGGPASASPTTTTSGRAAPAGASGGPAATGAAAGGGGAQPGIVADPAGDTFVDGTNDPITESRADIVRTAAGYGPGGITFTMQVQTPGDPRQDKKWSSASTFVDWAVDTNGDGQPDYEIQYSLDAGTLGGDVSRPGDETGATLCNVSAATYGADGYSITVDPACLGNPGSFSYRTTMYYDTNPKDDNADVASDVAPNGGMSFPIARPRP